MFSSSNYFLTEIQYAKDLHIAYPLHHVFVCIVGALVKAIVSVSREQTEGKRAIS